MKLIKCDECGVTYPPDCDGAGHIEVQTNRETHGDRIVLTTYKQDLCSACLKRIKVTVSKNKWRTDDKMLYCFEDELA